MDETGLRSIFSSNIKRFRNRKGLSQEKLAKKMANSLEIEVFELFKPQEAVSKSTANMINEYLEGFSESLKASLEKSVDQSLRKIKKSI